MAKKWFGPVLCPSGCCYEPPPPPPPPPCACASTECFEPGELNFSSVKFEADLDDSYSTFGRWKTLKCETNCKRVYDVREYERTVSGLSAFNGTYDIPYYVYDDYTSSWIEGDPLAIPCGVWFYPTITANITVTRTVRRYATAQDVYSLYTDTGCVETLQTQTYTFPMYLETRSGLIWHTDPLTSFVFASDVYGSTFGPPYSGLMGIQQTPAVAQHVRTTSPFECAGSSAPLPFTQTKNVDTRYHLHGSPLWDTPRINMSSIGVPLPVFGEPFLPVGVRNGSMIEYPLQSRYYDWSQYPYGGPGIPLSSTLCVLSNEEHEDQYNATATTIVDPFGTNPLVQCNPLYPTFSPNQYVAGPYRPNTWEFSNTAWRQYFRSILNAP